MKPHRVQRQRNKGWRMPENTVYVGRPTIWGNPYDIRRYGLDLCIALFRETATGGWNPMLVPEGPHQDQWFKWLYRDHCAWIKRIGGRPYEMIWCALRGKSLACWCPLDQPCHADVLLEIANGGPR